MALSHWPTWFARRRMTRPGGRRRRIGPERALRPRPLDVLESRCLLSSGLSASLVADIVPGSGSSNPSQVTRLGEHV
jgi:hypothetical protein